MTAGSVLGSNGVRFPHACVLVALTAWLSAAGCGDSDASPPTPTTSGTTGGSVSATNTSAGAGTTTGGGASGGGGSSLDPCLDAEPTCPTPPAAAVEGSGLVVVDRCAFPMESRGFGDDAATALVEQLTVAPLADVLTDLNRAGTTVSAVPGNPAGVSQAFGWNAGDQNVDYWIPQGLTGSADASAEGLVEGREVVLASWYYRIEDDPNASGEKGVRVSLADVTNPSSVAYRHLLLVEPFMNGSRPDFRAVKIHAGGMAWFGDLLYVADTVHGFRVFDLGRILRVDTGQPTIGYDATQSAYYAANYKFIVPQIGHYERLGDCTPRFSFVALDRSTTPARLVSGEYDAATITGRLFRWPLMSSGHLEAPVSFPSDAHFAMHSHLQGGVSKGATFWLSSSEPPAGAGALYVATEAATTQVVGWVDAPEDLMIDVPRNKLWSLSEGHGERFVFAVSPPPGE